MEEMFRSASAFNQPLNAWRTTAVKTMQFAFAESGAFYQNISAWSIASIKRPGGDLKNRELEDIFGSSHFYKVAEESGYCAVQGQCSDSPFSPHFYPTQQQISDGGKFLSLPILVPGISPPAHPMRAYTCLLARRVWARCGRAGPAPPHSPLGRVRLTAKRPGTVAAQRP